MSELADELMDKDSHAYKDKRIAELEALTNELAIALEGGAEYEHITREAMEASLKTKGSEGGGDE